MTNTPTETPDRNELKVMALRERLAQVVVEYEDRDAERRIDITTLSQRVQELEEQVAANAAPAEVSDVPVAEKD